LEVQGGAPFHVLVLCMAEFHDDPSEEPAVVSATLTEQMLHLTNRFEEERLRLEERTFHVEGEGEDG
jgi:hypothetical protein